MKTFNNQLFIDSGAHGLYNEFARNTPNKNKYDWYAVDKKFTKSFRLYLNQYAKFIKTHLPKDYIYANVDVIFNPELTWKSQVYLEEVHGLNPLPVIHANTPDYWFDKYLKKGYDYIAFGGLGQEITTRTYTKLTDRMFEKICDPITRKPFIKVHGFAMTSHPMMLRWPWYSVDSTSWLKYASYGYVIYPPYNNNQWRYDIPFFQYRISSRMNENALPYTYNNKENVNRIFLNYIQKKGFQIGQSEFKKVNDDYILDKDEQWVNKESGKKEVEIIIESGLCNNSDLRCSLNAIYFVDFANKLPSWPYPWNPKEINKQTDIFYIKNK